MVKRSCKCVRCSEWIGVGERELIKEVCRVCALEDQVGRLSAKLISAEEEIRNVRSAVGGMEREDIAARLFRVEEALRGFPGHSVSGASSRCVESQSGGALGGETQVVPSVVTRSWAQAVKGAKSVRQHQESGVRVVNRFQGLGEVMLDGDSGGEPSGVRPGGRGKKRSVILVGDSNVKRLEAAMGKDAGVKESVTFAPFSGAGIERIRDRIGAVVSLDPAEEVSVVLHVGTNDTPRTGSELIIAKLRQLIRACREARSGVRVTVCAIPNRTDKGGMVWSRSEGVNDRLTAVCAAEGATFLDTRKALRRCESPMAKDGVHFTGEGAKAVGMAIVKEMQSFLG